MSDLTIEEFCELHNACADGCDWALNNCKSMQECWEKLPDWWLVWVAMQAGVLSNKELRLFAVFCCRQLWHLLTKSGRNAVEVAERYAHGQATDAELTSAYVAAEDAAADALDKAIKDEIPYDVRRAMLAARSATEQSALQAARTTATILLYTISDWQTVKNNQATWLRANTTPNFAKVNHE